MQGRQSELALGRFEQEVLDVHHETFPCWKRDRADAIFCILAQFDIGNIMSIMMVPAFGSNPIGAPQAVKGTEDGLSAAPFPSASIGVICGQLPSSSVPIRVIGGQPLPSRL
jgi:hypothetical protein